MVYQPIMIFPVHRWKNICIIFPTNGFSFEHDIIHYSKGDPPCGTIINMAILGLALYGSAAGYEW